MLEVDARISRKLDQNLKEKKKKHENEESLGNVHEQKWESNMLEKHQKTNPKKAKRLKNETLKPWNGILINCFWKSKIWFQFQFSINLVSRPQFEF